MPAPSSSEHDALLPGTRFGEFEIVRVLGVGGFGIVYLARDHSLERDVALKEYMPASLASRGEGPQITIRSSSFAETYAIGLRSFINEARLLARFDHASLVKVYRFWEDNATAYMVMPYLQGVTLRDARRGMAYSPDEVWIRSVLDPILSALELLHREGVYHRDIAPDNILLPPEGPPVLLDFGAARRVISDRTQSLTAILKPSYAPIEQYAEMTQLRQGPWTDLYALGAVVHYLLFGAPPQPATARAVQDDGASIADRSVPGVSPRMLEAVAWALAIRPNQRPQSVDEFRGALDGRVAIPQLGRQSITLPGSLAPLAAAAAAVPPSGDYQPTLRVESGFSEPTRLETRPPAPATSVERSGATTFAPSLGPPPQLAPATGFFSGAMGEPVVSVAAAATAPVPRTVAPATPAAAAVVMPPVEAAAGSRLGYVIAGLGVVGLAAAAAIWLFGLPKNTATAGAPAVVPMASSPVASTASAALAAAPPAPVTAASASPAVTAPAAVPVVAVAMASAPAVAVPAAGATPPTASASIAAPAPRTERPGTASATPPAAPKVAATTSAAPAASRPKAVARKPEPGLPPVAESSTEYHAPAATVRPAPARETAAPRAAVAAEPAGPASAREACGGRVFLALAICMDRECEQPRFRSTAECIPILERKRARENR